MGRATESPIRTETETQRETDRQTEIETDRQTDRDLLGQVLVSASTQDGIVAYGKAYTRSASIVSLQSTHCYV